jgi:hypothetical protein
VALVQGAAVFARYEGGGAGLDASTASIVYGNYSFDSALFMLLVDFWLFLALGLYLDRVLPLGYG